MFEKELSTIMLNIISYTVYSRTITSPEFIRTVVLKM